MPEISKTKLAILGAGSFSTALVKIFSDNNSVELFWWIRRAEVLNQIRNSHHNPHYLSSVPIHLPSPNLSTNLQEIIDEADWILLGIPAAFLQKELSTLRPGSFMGKKIISVIKGMIPKKNMIISDFMNQDHGVLLDDFVVLTGPCHAEEIAQERLSYITLACLDIRKCDEVQGFIQNHYLRTQSSLDIYGTEYASVLKNIISIASGIFHGLGYGDNFQAVFISNSVQEIKYFLNALFPQKREINDSAYLGDLLVTAYSQFSRNRTFGAMIGKGYSIQSAQMEMKMIAEGYFASASIQPLIELNNLNMPITHSVFRILYEDADPAQEMEELTYLLH